MRQSRPILQSRPYYIAQYPKENEEKEDSKKICCCREWGCKQFLCAIVIILIAASVGSLALACVSLSRANYALLPNNLVENGILGAADLSVQLGANSALTVTVPNDLLDHVGRTYTVYSTTPFAHVLDISALGPLATTWDGINKKATLGGAVGDGLTFVVTDRDKIAVISNTNVVFSP